MNTFTHWRLAELIAEHLEKQSHSWKMGRMERLFFSFGNIAPDFSLMHWIHPHYYACSADYIYEKIKMPERRGRLGRAYKMGVLVHYLSDFCCFAHMEQFGGNLVEHMEYEYRIHQYLQSDFEHLRQKQMIRKNIGGITFQLDEIIEKRRERGSGYREDIEKSLEIAVLFAGYALAEYRTGMTGEKVTEREMAAAG